MARTLVILASVGCSLWSAAAEAGPRTVAAEACQGTVSRHATQKYAAGRAEFLGHPDVRQVSNAETGVSGRGQLDTAKGWVPFSYSCIYNIRTGQTGNVSVKADTHKAEESHAAEAAVGALIGVGIAAAIAGAVDEEGHQNHESRDSGWWSPAAGVQCNSYQSACYKSGHFSGHWTHRIYQ